VKKEIRENQTYDTTLHLAFLAGKVPAFIPELFK